MYKLRNAFIVVGLALIMSWPIYAHVKPNIVLITIPKSGSTYLLAMLKDNLKYEHMHFHTYYDGVVLRTELKDFFMLDGRVAKEHFRAPIELSRPSITKFMHPLDIEKYIEYSNKLVVHVRDPRQVLLSLVHHINNNVNNQYVPSSQKDWYYKQNISTQIDWGIDFLFADIIAWMADWVQYADFAKTNNIPIDILFSTYDELYTDPEMLFQRIVKFYNINQYPKFEMPKKDARVRYRKGDPNEWRYVFTPQQQTRIMQLIPKNLRQKFDWQ